MFGHF